MITDTLVVDRSTFEERTGWTLDSQGACRGDVCIPLAESLTGTTVPLDDLAAAMGLPMVHEPEHGLWAVGPDSVGGHTLVTAEAPELRLPDLDGNELALSSLRGKKVLLFAWSPY